MCIYIHIEFTSIYLRVKNFLFKATTLTLTLSLELPTITADALAANSSCRGFPAIGCMLDIHCVYSLGTYQCDDNRINPKSYQPTGVFGAASPTEQRQRLIQQFFLTQSGFLGVIKHGCLEITFKNEH